MPFKVYYLDDEPMLCENFADQFRSKEIAIITFTDPAKAIEAMKVSEPDLFFVDYRLPETNGDNVAFTVNSKIPICLITGDISIETKYKFEKIFLKPYSYDQIASVIKYFFDKKAV